MSARDGTHEEEMEMEPYPDAYEAWTHPTATKVVSHGGRALAAIPGLVNHRKMLGTADRDGAR